MTTVVDYASLKQAILDWSHNPLLTGGYADGLIQRAQAQIERDIPEQNFGNYIRFQESLYTPQVVSSGTAPVPSDWLGAKGFQIADGEGNLWPLIFKSPTWLYNTYPQRTAFGVPAYIARDTPPISGAPTGESPSLAITATAGQTTFDLSSLGGATVMLAALDGTTLTLGSDYSISGSTLTLTRGAAVGQVLLAIAVPVSAALSDAGDSVFTATQGQAIFTLDAPTGSVLLYVTLDGSLLNPATDYTVAGATLTLVNAAQGGQILFARYLSTGASTTSVFVFGPFPDSSYTLQGTYYASAPLLSATQTTNWMVLNAPNLLLAACMVQAATFLKDLQMLQMWQQDYTMRLEALVNADKAERWSASTMCIDVA